MEAQGQYDVSWLNNKKEELITELDVLNQEITILQKDNNRDGENALREKLNVVVSRLNKLNQEVEAIKNELKNLWRR